MDLRKYMDPFGYFCYQITYLQKITAQKDTKGIMFNGNAETRFLPWSYILKSEREVFRYPTCIRGYFSPLSLALLYNSC